MTAAAAEQPENSPNSLPAEFLSIDALGLALDKLPVAEAAVRLSAARDVYFDACQLYTVKPNETNFDALETTVQPYADAFLTSLEVLATDSRPVQYYTDIRQLLTVEEEKKIVTLNALLKKDVLAPQVHELPLQIVDAEAAEEAMREKPEIATDLKEAVRDMVLARFAHTLSNDTDIFSEEVSKSKAAKFIYYRAEIGKHALDMAKITASTILGMLIVNKFKRK